MKKTTYVCARCGTDWDKEVKFCPICYVGLITLEEWNKRHSKEGKQNKTYRPWVREKEQYHTIIPNSTNRGE